MKVLHLHLAPGEATERHQHTRPYIFVSLVPGKISNEVRGRTPKTSELEYGELRSSKGGFALAERNGGYAPLDLVVVELQKEVAPASQFTSEEADFKYHNVIVGHLLDGQGWRAYEINIASEGYTEKHLELYNRLMIAVSEVNLQMDVAAKGKSLLQLQPGDVRWFEGGDTVSSVNKGNGPAKFIVIEFSRGE